MRRACLLLTLTACGDNLKVATDAAVDAFTSRDAPLDGMASNCELAASIGAITPFEALGSFTSGGGGGGGGGGGPSSYWVDNKLTDDPVFDVISLEMYKKAAFASGWPTTFPVTVPLTGPELDFQTCGACVRAFGDATATTWTGEYFATAGTLTLTALSQTRITGTLTNLTLVHVEKNQPDTVPLNDGCTTTVQSLSFDSVPTQAFTGTLSIPARRHAL